MRVLVSGFEPFLDEKVNPTQEIANFVNSCDGHGRRGWASLDVRGVVLPVLFDQAFQRLEQERLLFNPDIIVSFGLAGGRETVDIEQTARNIRGGATGGVASNNTAKTIAGASTQVAGSAASVRGDNSGRIGEGLIDPDAPDELVTTLPSGALLKGLRARGLPARFSYSAGTYVCNDLFFMMQNQLLESNTRSGFIHVPRLAKAGELESPSAWAWSRFEATIDSILTTLAEEEQP